MIDELKAVLSWIPIVAPVLAVLAMILWDVGRPWKLFQHWDRGIELALLGGLVITGIIQLGINDRQGKITKRQTDILERQAKLSEVVERPWIAIQGVQPFVPLTFEDSPDGLNLLANFVFILKNTGHIPATHVLVFPIFSFVSKYSDINDVWDKCDQYRTIPLANRGSGISIFPGEPGQLLGPVRMVPDDVKRLGVQPTSGAPMLVGCVDYGNDIPRHQTRFVYEIDKKGPNGLATFFSASGGNISIPDIIVNVSPILAGNPD